jgi:hypothetical protein
MSPPGSILPIILLLFPHAIHAQVGTLGQDLTTIAAYSQQLPCAQSCFMRTGFCPQDTLGQELGCQIPNNCNSRGWEAKNDCYCRSDRQATAQQWLSSCINSACTVGDAAIDASTAGSIYNQYCQAKGYTAGPLPATVQATITAADGSVHTSTKVLNSDPTAIGTGSAPGSDASASSSKSNSLPLTTIIGIVVGSLAGLAFLTVIIKFLKNSFCPCFQRKPAPAPPQLPYADNKAATYPMQPYYQEGYYPSPRIEDELRPDDSLSVVGGFARPAPTLVSNGPPRGW